MSRAPFDFIGSLTAWTRSVLAAADQVLDALAVVALALELGRDDLVDVEEAVLLEADVDERGLHAGQHVVDDALVDVAGDRAAVGALEVDLGDAGRPRGRRRGCSLTSTETSSSRLAGGSGARLVCWRRRSCGRVTCGPACSRGVSASRAGALAAGFFSSSRRRLLGGRGTSRRACRACACGLRPPRVPRRRLASLPRLSAAARRPAAAGSSGGAGGACGAGLVRPPAPAACVVGTSQWQTESPSRVRARRQPLSGAGARCKWVTKSVASSYPSVAAAPVRPWQRAAGGSLARRRGPAQPLHEARPGPRLELAVAGRRLAAGRLEVLEPGVRLLDHQQLVYFALGHGRAEPPSVDAAQCRTGVGRTRAAALDRQPMLRSPRSVRDQPARERPSCATGAGADTPSVRISGFHGRCEPLVHVGTRPSATARATRGTAHPVTARPSERTLPPRR